MTGSFETKMPIAGFFGPSSSYKGIKADGEEYVAASTINEEIYRQIADAGINLITYGLDDYSGSLGNRESVIRQLELCEKYGISMLVQDSELLRLAKEGKNLEDRLALYRQYASFAGIFITDEPESKDYFDLETVRKTWPDHKKKKLLADFIQVSQRLNELPGIIGYINLLPYKEVYGEISHYQKYLEEYCSKLHGKMLSFDEYPFYDGNARELVLNLDMHCIAARKYNLPFWSHIQAGSHFNDGAQELTTVNDSPTEAQMDWNINVCLAFGTKGIQYFTLLQPYYYALAPEGKLDAERNGLIGMNGVPTKWYDYAKKMNQYIGKIDRFLMNAKNEGVLVSGQASIDTEGCQSICSTYREVSSVESSSLAGAMTGCFDYQGRTMLYVVNYDTTSSATVTVSFVNEQEYVATDSEGTRTGKGRHFTTNMCAGEAILVLLGSCELEKEGGRRL